jgi:hypothetical protein
MKLHLGHILILFAIALAGAAGYISVIGWGKLFAGSAVIVMIVMGIIESAKVVTTLYLHNYGKKINKEIEGPNGFVRFFKRMFSLNSYLTLAVIVTMTLTSVGIYGFLTNAYQETATEFSVNEKEVQLIENKKIIFENKKQTINEQVDFKNKQINSLVELRSQQETRLDSLLANNHWSNARRTQKQIEEAADNIKVLQNDVDTLISQAGVMNDSIASLDIKILNKQTSSEASAELGPLKYISSLTGLPMDNVINYLVFAIMFIFDPMAISLVVAVSKIFEYKRNNGKNEGSNVSNREGLELSEEERGELDKKFTESMAERRDDFLKDELEKYEDLNFEVNPPRDTDKSDTVESVNENNDETPVETVQYSEGENGEFVKKEDAKVAFNPKYIEMLSALYKDGSNKAGDDLISFEEFINELKNRNIDFTNKEAKDFLTACLLLKIVHISLDNTERKYLKGYDAALEIIKLTA